MPKTKQVVVQSTASYPRISRNPQAFMRARDMAARGNIRELAALMEDAMSGDGHISGCLTGRRAGFQRNLVVEPYSDQDEDQKRAAWLASVLEQAKFRHLLGDLFKCRLYGQGVVDPVWALQDGRLIPTEFKWYKPHYFRHDDEGILRIDHRGELRPIPETAIVIDMGWKNAIMGPALLDWSLKMFGLDRWATYVGKYGNPFVLGKIPTEWGTELVNSILAQLSKLSSDGTGVVPEDIDVQLLQPPRTATSDHQTFHDRANASISTSLLGHAQSVSEQKGMRIGQNDVPLAVRHEIAVDDIYEMECILNGWLPQLWRLNFSDTRYPKIRIDRPINLAEALERLKIAFDHGVVHSTSHYRALGIDVHPDQKYVVPSNAPPNVDWHGGGT